MPQQRNPDAFLDEFRGRVFTGQWPTLTELFAISVERFGERACFTVYDPERLSLSYAEALDMVGRVAAKLAALGVGRGDRVVVTGKNGPEWAVAWLAALHAGATVVPIDCQIRRDETANNLTLKDGLRKTRGGREERAIEMSDGLAKVGIKGAFEGALKFVGNPELISRTHFARFLVESGICRETNEVFRKYLTEGKPGFVPHRWASLKDAVSWITGAGGMAVIAHPARYKFTPNEEFALFTEFKALGGQGVEVVTGSHTVAEYAIYAETAREFGLAASRGSDFHSPDESHTELGTLPFLPSNLTPIWDVLASRIQ